MRPSWTGSNWYRVIVAGAMVAATIAVASPATAQNQDLASPDPTPAVLVSPVPTVTSAARLIIRRDADGGAPVFDTVAANLSGIMRIATDPTITGVELDGTSQLMWQPSDPSYTLQWEDQVTGMESAWDVTRGDPGIVIAVVDSGVNPGPEFGTRLLPGVSFIGTDPAVDQLGHGTSVAAVAAAEANNDIAGAGVCSACTILPVQVADATGQVPWSAAANGIIWAVDQGADIINLSFGSDSPSGVLGDSIDYALSRGVVVTAAAGNFGTDLPVYPANYPGVLSVAGHDRNFDRNSWSSYGPSVDVAAPGCVQGLSSDASTPVCGTSFASPWVAGAVALLLATEGPLTPTEVETAIESSTIANDWVETGRVDASVLLRSGTANLDPVGPRVSAGDVNLTGQYSGNVQRVELVVDGSIVAADPSPADGRFQLMWDTTATTAGDHMLQVDAIDARGLAVPGNTMSVRVYEGSGFDDVVRHSYYDTAVTWMVDNSITNGTTPTTYEPDRPVTRAQAATFLWRYSGNPTAQTSSPFVDTATDSWYTSAVDWMVESGITSGTSPSTFEPDRTVTRAQMATFLWRLAGRPEPSASSSFADIQSGRWYTTAVDWMVSSHLTTGTTPGNYSPDSPVTRAQIATFLWRYDSSSTP